MVVVGDVMADVSVRLAAPPEHGSDAPAAIATRPGGGGANTAAWLARLGVPTLFVGRVGDDAAGAEAARALAAAGVEARLARGAEPTGTVVVIVEPGGERTMLADPGANAGLAAADLPAAAFAPGGHLHLSGYTLLRPGSRAAGRAALAMARSAGMTASVDASSAAPLRQLGADAFLALIDGAGTLLATLDEAAALAATRDPDTAAARIAAGREAVVKLGAGGALWRGADGRVARVPAAAPPGPVVDTTGAGDAFAAAWIAARRAGADPQDALGAACALGAEVVARPGARP